MSYSQRLFAMLGLLSLAILLTGCSERRTTVTGKVTYNGAVLDKTGGKIVFVSKSGVQVPASINADGTYRAQGVILGENRVAVYYEIPQSNQGRRLPKKGEPAESSAQPSSPFLTPPEYASPDTSKLTANIADPAVYNADLVGPPIP